MFIIVFLLGKEEQVRWGEMAIAGKLGPEWKCSFKAWGKELMKIMSTVNTWSCQRTKTLHKIPYEAVFLFRVIHFLIFQLHMFCVANMACKLEFHNLWKNNLNEKNNVITFSSCTCINSV